MTHLEKRLREAIVEELKLYRHYDGISPTDVATDLLPVIMGVLESELHIVHNK